MKFSIDRQDQYTILKIDEEKLDSTIAPEVKSEFVTLQAEGVKNIVLNMEVVKYSDSSGLSALLVGNRLFKDTGSFVMCKLNEHVMKLISISQLDKVIDILPTVEEAIDAVMFNDIERGLREAGEE
ncbi:STAS domain-containing protein [Marinoscillum sp. 108]|jgi:anti-sigma B factor antagonist|uniref:Anti-sigma factor antagonist n=1 Tax=Marinoscillum luteum TaxID=861051 RepID=A0ABW7NCV6_9BACT|nr:STAS domain-containing protein [Marinoscillum sp. 108]VXD13413.1 Anti-sigma factor antagonist [Marinoscillum sp. 108]